MQKLESVIKTSSFEYIYMFVMVIYMAQMTADTSRMISNLGGNPIPFLIPIVMTLILLKRHPISFKNKKLQTILLVVTGWAVLLLLKLGKINTEEISYLFFLYYAIIMAYIHVRVYGQKMFVLYEDIMVKFSQISLILWGFAVILPSVSSSVFHMFPETGYGNNFLYLFNWMDPVKGQASLLLRNAGCSWEPGRFAIMVVLAILVNLSRNGIKFKGNKNVVYLLLALLSTQSTTGYSIVILLYTLFYIKHFSAKYIIGLIFVVLPLVIGLFSLDFMGEKIKKQLDVESELDQMQTSINWMNKTREDGEYAFSTNRFSGMILEFDNVLHDPILGYGRNTNNSYFRRNVSSHIVLTGGIIKQFGQYGIPLGLFFYYILYKSSVAFALNANIKRKFALFLSIVLFSISYITFCTPIFTAFWFYGYFKKDESIYNHERAIS